MKSKTQKRQKFDLKGKAAIVHQRNQAAGWCEGRTRNHATAVKMRTECCQEIKQFDTRNGWQEMESERVQMDEFALNFAENRNGNYRRDRAEKNQTPDTTKSDQSPIVSSDLRWGRGREKNACNKWKSTIEAREWKKSIGQSVGWLCLFVCVCVSTAGRAGELFVEGPSWFESNSDQDGWIPSRAKKTNKQRQLLGQIWYQQAVALGSMMLCNMENIKSTLDDDIFFKIMFLCGWPCSPK